MKLHYSPSQSGTASAGPTGAFLSRSPSRLDRPVNRPPSVGRSFRLVTPLAAAPDTPARTACRRLRRRPPSAQDTVPRVRLRQAGSRWTRTTSVARVPAVGQPVTSCSGQELSGIPNPSAAAPAYETFHRERSCSAFASPYRSRECNPTRSRIQIRQSIPPTFASPSANSSPAARQNGNMPPA